MANWLDEYARMVADCAARESKLTDWEQDFIQSLQEQLDEGRSLSPRQTEILDRIWEKVT